MSDSLSQVFVAPYFIKYNPALKAEFGSQNAVILFDRLEYWFSKKKNEFYKFIEPCAHPLCKEGDTWSEELGFSKKVFKTAFDKIGIRYKSKTAFEKESDPFKGKFFAYYQDRQTKKTIFVRNNQLLTNLYSKLKFLLQEKIAKKTVGQGDSLNYIKGSPTERPLVSPHVRANKDKQINTSFKKNEKMNLKKNETITSVTEDASERMIEIWTKELEGRGVPIVKSDVSEKLNRALRDNFSNSLELWRKHCVKIASSKFLMGEKEKTNYEIRLMVATSKQFIDQLSNGKYELGTRESIHFKEIKRLQEDAKRAAVALEVIENQKVRLEDEYKSHKKRLVLESVRSLSETELHKLKQRFEKDQVECPTFKRGGWGSKIIQLQFDVFLQKAVQGTIDLNEIEARCALARQDLEERRGVVAAKYEVLLERLGSLRGMEILPKNESDKF